MHKGPRGTEAVESGHVVTVGTLRAHHPGTAGVQSDTDHIVAIQDVRGLDKKQNGKGWSDEGVSYTVDTHATQGVAVAFAQNTRDEVRLVNGDGQIVGALAAQPGMKQTSYIAVDAAHAFKVRGGCEGGGKGYLGSDEVAFTISTHQDQHIFSEPAAVVPTSTVRRLTPVECERLQGFPDNFTAIPWRKKGAEDCPDGPRYKALGNSMAVPVMRWIGERINRIDDLLSLL